MARKQAEWYRILLEARALGGSREPLTSASLASQAEIPPAVASAWLGKFVRWGYAARTGLSARGKRQAGRPATLYTMTKWGMSYEPKRESNSKSKK